LGAANNALLRKITSHLLQMNPIVLKNLLKKKEKGKSATPVKLIDFEMKQILGQGAFGKVKLNFNSGSNY
jgi:hypothetical protein